MAVRNRSLKSLSVMHILGTFVYIAKIRHFPDMANLFGSFLMIFSSSLGLVCYV